MFISVHIAFICSHVKESKSHRTYTIHSGGGVEVGEQMAILVKNEQIYTETAQRKQVKMVPFLKQRI